MKRIHPTTVIVHFNKRNALKGKPWTVHVKGACIPAKEVVFKNIRVDSIFKPEKKTNPRAWFRAIGFVTLNKHGIVTITKD